MSQVFKFGSQTHTLLTRNRNQLFAFSFNLLKTETIGTVFPLGDPVPFAFPDSAKPAWGKNVTKSQNICMGKKYQFLQV